MGRCFVCNTEVIWQNDFDAEDVGYTEPGIIQYFTCPKCGAEYEVFEPFEKEEE